MNLKSVALLLFVLSGICFLLGFVWLIEAIAKWRFNRQKRRLFERRVLSDQDWKIWYNSYLRSPEWQVTRQSALVRAGNRCERCGGGGRIDVHHLPGSYSRIPNELPWDLAALCYDCHRRQHPGKHF